MAIMPKLMKGVGEKPKRNVKKRALVVGIIAIVIAAVACAGYAVFATRPQGSGDSSVVDSPAVSQSATDAITQAQARDDLGDTDGAAAILTAAIGKSSTTIDKTELLSVKGAMLANSGKTDEGVAALRQAISLTPSNPQLYRTLGSIYEVSDQKDKAVATYKEGIANLADGPRKTAQLNELNGAIGRAQSDE